MNGQNRAPEIPGPFQKRISGNACFQPPGVHAQQASEDRLQQSDRRQQTGEKSEGEVKELKPAP